MIDRKPIESDRYWDEVHFECSCCPESEVRELETEHNELLSKAEELEELYNQKCKMFNSQSAVLRLKEEKIRDLKKQRDIAVEALKLITSEAMHKNYEVKQFAISALAQINQIGEK